MVIDGRWQTDIAVSIFNQEGPSELEGHMSVPDINSPPDSSSHLAFNHRPGAGLGMQPNVLRNPNRRSKPSPCCRLEVHLREEDASQDCCPRVINDELIVPQVYQSPRGFNE